MPGVMPSNYFNECGSVLRALLELRKGTSLTTCVLQGCAFKLELRRCTHVVIGTSFWAVSGQCCVRCRGVRHSFLNAPPSPGAGNPSMGGKLLPRDPLAAFVAKYFASTSLGLVASYEFHLFDGALGANGIVI